MVNRVPEKMIHVPCVVLRHAFGWPLTAAAVFQAVVETRLAVAPSDLYHTEDQEQCLDQSALLGVHMPLLQSLCTVSAS